MKNQQKEKDSDRKVFSIKVVCLRNKWREVKFFLIINNIMKTGTDCIINLEGNRKTLYSIHVQC